MRLGLSMMLMAALAAGSVACSSSTGDGAGGSGGSGSGTGGDDTGEGGGTTTAQGTGGGDTGTGGGDGSDGVCVSENVPVDADGNAFCDVDCDVAFSNGNPDVAQCTISCADDADCGADLTCFANEDGSDSACLYDCIDGAACPGTAEYVCDQEVFFCDPDGIAE